MDDFIVVLNDGETFTSMEGCRILRVPDTVDEVDPDFAIERAFSRGAGLDIYELYCHQRQEYKEQLFGSDYLELWEGE